MTRVKYMYQPYNVATVPQAPQVPIDKLIYILLGHAVVRYILHSTCTCTSEYLVAPCSWCNLQIVYEVTAFACCIIGGSVVIIY